MDLQDKKNRVVNGEIRPFISMIIHDYDYDLLQACLNDIFKKVQAFSFEVIVCDNASTDGAWDLANKYMRKHPDLITIHRNQIHLGECFNLDKSMQMAKGKYYVELTRDRRLDIGYVNETILKLESDPLLIHSYIGEVYLHQRRYPYPPVQYKSLPELKRSENPLVSICVYNYNYGRFLRQCLESIAEQTYGNIEICFSDNASSDNSWEIALEFSRQYPKKMSLARNRINYGASSNLRNCLLSVEGKYLLMLCSDDAMKPDFIMRCVALLERNQDAAFAMVHRDIIDEENNLTVEPSFYDQTCLIPGSEQAAVYMMAAVNPSVSQILYNREKIQGKGVIDGLNHRWFAARIMDFNICCEYSIIYIKESLLLNRVHLSSDGVGIDNNLVQCMGQYVLLHQFSEIASVAGLEKAAGRLGSGLDKVGRLCLRYVTQFLLRGDKATALRYFHLAQAITPEIINDPIFQLITSYFNSVGVSGESKQKILNVLQTEANLAARNISYEVPPGSIILN